MRTRIGRQGELLTIRRAVGRDPALAITQGVQRPHDARHAVFQPLEHVQVPSPRRQVHDVEAAGRARGPGQVGALRGQEPQHVQVAGRGCRMHSRPPIGFVCVVHRHARCHQPATHHGPSMMTARAYCCFTSLP